MNWGLVATILIATGFGLLAGYLAGIVRRRNQQLREAYSRIDMIAHLAEQKSATQSMIQRSVHVGHAAELFAPYLPGFPGLPPELRFLGSPIDFVAFEGLEGPGLVTIVFVEVKSGRHQKLTDRQIRIRGAVDARRIKWVTYSMPTEAEPGGSVEVRDSEIEDPRRAALKKLRERSQHGSSNQS